MLNQGPWINFMPAYLVCKRHRQLFVSGTHCNVCYIVILVLFLSEVVLTMNIILYHEKFQSNFILFCRIVIKVCNARCCKIGNWYMAMLTTYKCWKAFLAFLKEELQNPLKITFCLPTYLVHFLTAREFLQILTIYHQQRVYGNDINSTQIISIDWRAMYDRSKLSQIYVIHNFVIFLVGPFSQYAW